MHSEGGGRRDPTPKRRESARKARAGAHDTVMQMSELAATDQLDVYTQDLLEAATGGASPCGPTGSSTPCLRGVVRAPRRGAALGRGRRAPVVTARACLDLRSSVVVVDSRRWGYAS